MVVRVHTIGRILTPSRVLDVTRTAQMNASSALTAAVRRLEHVGPDARHRLLALREKAGTVSSHEEIETIGGQASAQLH